MLCTWRVGHSSARRTRNRSAVLGFLISTFAWVAFLGIPGAAWCADVNLRWDPVLDEPLVAGYEVHYGLASGQYQWSVHANANGAATNTKTVENLQAGNTYYFSVRACNHDPELASGFSNEVSALVESPDTIAPTVSLSTAPTGPTYTSARTVSVNADASDNVGVSQVKFYDGATLVATKTAAPFNYVWTISSADNGGHSWTAKAYDAAGNVTTSDPLIRTVDIPSGSPDTIAPTISLTTAPTGQTYTSAQTVSVNADAADDVGVTQVMFYDGTTLIATKTAAPFSYAWTISGADNGSHSWTATAYDAAGNATTSNPLSRTVNIPYDPVAGLVAAYGFNEAGGTALADASGTGNDGLIEGATWTTAGRFGAALSFDGIDDWVTVGDADSLDLTTGMTLEAWVYSTRTLGRWSTAIFKEQPNSLSYALCPESPSAAPASCIYVGAESCMPGSNPLPANQWTHLAATFDGTTQRLFVNGVQVASSPRSGSMVTSNGVLRIGGNSVWGEFFDGLIDEIRIYNRALTAAQIQADMGMPVGVVVPPPDTTPPTVSLSTEPTSQTYTSVQTVNVNADAADDVGVVQVKFYKGSTLMATMTGAPYSYAWAISSVDNGTHSWTAKAYDEAGNVTTSGPLSRTVDIAPFVADFTADTTEVVTNSPVSFYGSASGDVTGWFWDFGDGGTSTSQTAVHTYTLAGTYDVSLTVTGPGGSAEEIKTDYITVNAPLVAEFSASATSGYSPLMVRFNDASTGDIQSCQWDFGDGGTSSELDPAHTYVTPGTYDVTLTVTGPGGSDTISKVDLVHVHADELMIEFGEIALDHEWKRVDFERVYTDPIVIIKPVSENDADPAVVRVDAVDSQGFRVRVQEWDYLDDVHNEEAVGYIVVERGFHQLPDGAWIEAGSLEVGADFVVAELDAPFASAPVVLTTVATNNEERAVTTRMRGIDEYQFEIKLQEQESNSQDHVPETVGYVAWEPSVGEIDGMLYEVGRTGDQVKHRLHSIGFSTAFDLPPVFLAGMQTADGGDTAYLRSRNKGFASADVWVDEEASRDTEINHTSEVAGYIAVGLPGAEMSIEVGELEVDQAWQRVDFEQAFSHPVVVAGPLSANDSDAAVVRVDAVDSDGFWIRLQEWRDLDGIDAAATVSYMVMERGRHQLPNGAWVEANLLGTRKTNAFDHVTFPTPFVETPVVLTTVTTDNDPDAVTTRVRGIDLGGFDVGLEEAEADDQVHAVETIAYIAFEPFSGEIEGLQVEVGRTDDLVTDNLHTIPYQNLLDPGAQPVFLAAMQTTDGGNTASLRCVNKGAESVDVWVEEEQSLDAEVAHITEVVGYLIVGDSGAAQH